MKNVGLPHNFLGVQFNMPMIVFVSQAKYVMTLLGRIRMENCKENYIPMEVAKFINKK
jgi:hypothetical protein